MSAKARENRPGSKVLPVKPTRPPNNRMADGGTSTNRCVADELIKDLWNFVENVTDEDPDRTDKFFALRERVRNHYASPSTTGKRYVK